jgi:hypothetical protein
MDKQKIRSIVVEVIKLICQRTKEYGLTLDDISIVMDRLYATFQASKKDIDNNSWNKFRN